MKFIAATLAAASFAAFAFTGAETTGASQAQSNRVTAIEAAVEAASK